MPTEIIQQTPAAQLMQQVQAAQTKAQAALITKESKSASSATMPAMPYENLQVIRQTLYGQMLYGVDVKTKKPVAIKLSSIRQMNAKQNKIADNPVREGQALRFITQKASSPYITKWVAEHNSRNHHWLVTEFVEGGELFDYVVKKGHLEEAEAKKFFKQLLSALSDLNKLNIIHFDISLENMLLDSKGNIKLCDFGVAARVPDNSMKLEPIKGVKPGKLNYMSPEILGELRFNGHKADMFAAGVVLFMMLTGSRAFKFANESDPRFAQLVKGDLRELLKAQGLSDCVSEDAEDLLKKLLCYEDKRATVDEIMNHKWLQ